MKSKLTQLLGLWALAFAFCVPLALQAAEHEEKAPPPPLADLWIVHVKAGHTGEFETQFKAHLAVREEAGDPRAWQVFTPVVGEDMSHYAIRYCCNDWAGQDAYDAWSLEASAVQEHWNANVHPHVASYQHYLDLMDYQNSNWPDENPGWQYFGVTRWDVKPGGYAAMNAAREKMSQMAIEHEWPRHWSWINTIGGSGGVVLVSPHVNYASMAPPEQGFAAFAAEHMGEEEAGEVLSAFSSNLMNSSYTIYRHRKDLSMAEE